MVIAGIEVLGNKRTKEKVVFREMDFAVGDSIVLSKLGETFERNRLFIMNCGMFNSVKINIDTWDQSNNHLTIKIEVRESWYVYPVPVFELADRDFNVWWKDFNLSLKRLNLGLRFYHLNMTGNRDRLKLSFQAGFSQKYEIKYTLPIINKAQTLGLTTNVFYSRTKEMGYTTEANRLLFFRSEEDFLLRRARGGFTLHYRPKLLEYHNFKLEYQKNTADEFVLGELNPNYFLDGRTSQQLFYLEYEFIYDRRDIRPYPMKGFQVNATVQKEGLGIFKERNGLYVSARYDQYFSFTKRLSLELISKGKLALVRGWQPYNNYSSLGYSGDFLRGYELYVMDGLDYFYLKSTFRIKLFERTFNFSKLMPLNAFKVMPLKIFFTVNNDTGYVNDPQFGEINTLGNKWLWGGGVGLNFVLYYDKVFRFEYSFNQLGERGLFMQYKLSF